MGHTCRRSHHLQRVRLSHLVIAIRIREIPSEVGSMIVEIGMEGVVAVGVVDKSFSTKTKVRLVVPVSSLT